MNSYLSYKRCSHEKIRSFEAPRQIGVSGRGIDYRTMRLILDQADNGFAEIALCLQITGMSGKKHITFAAC